MSQNKTYYIKSVDITGIPLSRQTIKFSDLKDVAGTSVPAKFLIAPKVNAYRGEGTVDFIVSNINEMSFQISRDGDYPHGSTSWDTNIVITGIPSVLEYNTYCIKAHIITGTPLSRQTINFGDLKNTAGNSVPAKFLIAPMVDAYRGEGTVDFNVTNITTTSFQISHAGDIPHGSTSWEADIFIVGKPAVVTGGYTIEENIDEIGYLLNDIEELDFKPQYKTLLINKGQTRLINILMPQYYYLLENLMVIDEPTITLDSDKRFSLLTLDETIYQKDDGIISLYTNEKYAEFMSLKEYELHSNKGSVFSSKHPYYYIKGNYIYFLPDNSSDITECEIIYIREPRIVIFDTADTSNNIDCEFDRQFRDIIIGLALRDYRKVSLQANEVYLASLEAIEGLKSKKHTALISRAGLISNFYNPENVSGANICWAG